VRVRSASRTVAVLAAAAAMVVGLSACQVKVGQAAYVDKIAISESDVASYVSVTAADPGANSISAKSFAVQELIKNVLLARLARDIGGTLPSDSDLSTLHDSALSQVFSQQISGADADKQLRIAADQKGLRPKFDALYVHNIELSTAIGSYLQSASADEQGRLQKDINAIKVKLNPRYGTWSSNNLQVTGATSPSWLCSATAPRCPAA
jgi:hypothetical protein